MPFTPLAAWAVQPCRGLCLWCLHRCLCACTAAPSRCNPGAPAAEVITRAENRRNPRIALSVLLAVRPPTLWAVSQAAESAFWAAAGSFGDPAGTFWDPRSTRLRPSSSWYATYRPRRSVSVHQMTAAGWPPRSAARWPGRQAGVSGYAVRPHRPRVPAEPGRGALRSAVRSGPPPDGGGLTPRRPGPAARRRWT
jgi:hypothetical protein